MTEIGRATWMVSDTAALLTVAGRLAVMATTRGANVELTILNLEQELAQSWVRGDRAFVETLLAADCTVTDATGQVWTKAQLIEEAFVRGTRKVDSMEVDDVSVRVLGAAAVATGRLRTAGTKQGQPVSTVLRFTDVFRLRDGHWQLVASQDTRIAAQEDAV